MFNVKIWTDFYTVYFKVHVCKIGTRYSNGTVQYSFLYLKKLVDLIPVLYILNIRFLGGKEV